MTDLITCYAAIGNSDDKLSQRRWADYQRQTRVSISFLSHEIHFFGHSETIAPWQNACWVFTIKPSNLDSLKHMLGVLAGEYDQDSIAFGVVPHVEFIEAKGSVRV